MPIKINNRQYFQILQYLTLRHRQDQGVVTWLNMAAAHLFALALPQRPGPVTARIAVSFIMYHGRMLHSHEMALQRGGAN